MEGWGAERDWVGADPYEGLNAPIARLARWRLTRQATIQAYKRLPFAPPWPLKATPRANSKTLALALSGYATPAGLQLGAANRFLGEIPRELERLRFVGSGAAWGYHFDVQTRHLFYDRNTPNAIATCFVVDGLCDAHQATGNDRLLETALAARPYLMSLRKVAPGHGPFFAYVAEGSQLIHNANLLVCGTLARLNDRQPDEAVEAAVREASGTTIARQRADGLWDYGEAENLRWADNFHTAYTLEGLRRVDATFGIGGTALQDGLEAWRRCFFEPDGWARYYPDRRFPLEPHCCATAIDLLCALHGKRRVDEQLELALRIAEVAVRELWIPEEGRFAFRRTPRGLNRRAFTRWTNAPMFRALAVLLSSTQTREREWPPAPAAQRSQAPGPS